MIEITLFQKHIKNRFFLVLVLLITIAFCAYICSEQSQRT